VVGVVVYIAFVFVQIECLEFTRILAIHLSLSPLKLAWPAYIVHEVNIQSLSDRRSKSAQQQHCEIFQI